MVKKYHNTRQQKSSTLPLALAIPRRQAGLEPAPLGWGLHLLQGYRELALASAKSYLDSLS